MFWFLFRTVAAQYLEAHRDWTPEDVTLALEEQGKPFDTVTREGAVIQDARLLNNGDLKFT